VVGVRVVREDVEDHLAVAAARALLPEPLDQRPGPWRAGVTPSPRPAVGVVTTELADHPDQVAPQAFARPRLGEQPAEPGELEFNGIDDGVGHGILLGAGYRISEV
jgi:hypothetical protein